MKLAGLAASNLRRDLAGALLLTAAVVAGVAALAFFVALGVGSRQAVRQLFPESERTVEVVPPHLRLGDLFGVKLDDAMVERLKALPSVTAVQRKMLLRAPASSLYRGDFFGVPLNMALEVAAVGVDPGLLAADLPTGESFAWSGQGPVPACISDRLLALYNSAFAPSRGLPTLTPSMTLGFVLPLTVGQSLVTAAAVGHATPAIARIACVSPRAMLAGLSVPLAVVQGWNRAAGVDAQSYSSVALSVASEDRVPAVAEAVHQLGLSVDESERQGALVAGSAVLVFTWVLGLLSLLILGLAAVGIGQALTLSVRSRRRELGLLRALGATPFDVASLVLWEAALLGLAGGLVGLTAAAVAVRAANWAVAQWLPVFPGRPVTLLLLSPTLGAAVVALGLGAALLGAWIPARLAARLDPIRALTG